MTDAEKNLLKKYTANEQIKKKFGYGHLTNLSLGQPKNVMCIKDEQ